MGLPCPSRPFRIDLIGHGRATIGVSTLPHDLDAIAAFQPDAIATLLSAHELRLLGRGDLLDALPNLTPQWHHIPLRASGGSDARFERLWSYTGHRLRAVLRRGGRVLLHCGEDGARARWAAARLLAELGVPPSEAAARAGMRPGPAALSFAPKRAMTEHHLAGRILGGLFGGALGDAYGYPVEFKSRKAIKAAFGKGGLTEPRGRLVVSDDTQMTLFTADGLLAALAAEGPRTPERILARIRYAYLAWFRTQRDEWTTRASGFSQHRELWTVRAPGSTCLAALHAGARGTPEKPVNDSKGSGAVMRVAPLGLVPAIDADEAFRLAHAAAALTHGHPNGRLSAAALASLLRDLLDDMPIMAALGLMEARLQATPGGDETLAALRKACALADGDLSSADAIAALGEGWTGEEALAIGLYAVLRADSFEAAVRLAADHDGDSDTTAAIAGQIWGVVHGLDAAPHGWIQRLDVLEPLCDIAHRLVATAAASAAPAREEAPRLVPA
jgi:ADP-ribosyl-[dinitrogen reductase] hydrolase